MARIWTSCEPLRGREFCSYLNELVMKDNLPDAQMLCLVKVCRVLNFALCNDARKDKVPWPESLTLYRGGALPKEHRLWFKELKTGDKFRAPRYTATSNKLHVAETFLANNSDPYKKDGVIWVIKLDRIYKCKHVNYLDAISSCKGEAEFLFQAYSPFEVEDVKEPTDSEPFTTITLKAAVDGKHESEHLPLSPWG
jgi:hypothetical protein